MNSRSRILEDVAFLGGVGVAVYGAIRESHHICDAHGFPWALLITAAVLIAPKMLGRATAGRIWQTISTRFGARPGGTP